MSQFNLYYKTQLETEVSILPSQMTANIDEFILENLTTKVKDKITEHGIITKINHVIDYGLGIIDKSNFTGAAVFNVKYECLLCHPEPNLEIICKIDFLIFGIISASNGPISIAVQINSLDVNKFEIIGETVKHIASGKILKKEDYVNVTIIKIKSDLGKQNIHAIAKLNDLATKDEIKRYESDINMIYGKHDSPTSVYI